MSYEYLKGMITGKLMALRVIAKEHFMVSAIISDVQEDFSSFVNELEADEAEASPCTDMPPPGKPGAKEEKTRHSGNKNKETETKNLLIPDYSECADTASALRLLIESNSHLNSTAIMRIAGIGSVSWQNLRRSKGKVYPATAAKLNEVLEIPMDIIPVSDPCQNFNLARTEAPQITDKPGIKADVPIDEDTDTSWIEQRKAENQKRIRAETGRA